MLLIVIGHSAKFYFILRGKSDNFSAFRGATLFSVGFFRIFIFPNKYDIGHVFGNSTCSGHPQDFLWESKGETLLLCIILGLLCHLPPQFSSVAQSCPTLCNPMKCSTPGVPVHHQLLEFTQSHVRRVSDAIQPYHSLLSPFPAFNLSQHQGLFKCVSSSHQVARVLEFQLQHQTFQ